MGHGRLALKIGGRWDVGLNNWWEMELTEGGLSKMVGGWPPKQMGDRRLRHLPQLLHYIDSTNLVVRNGVPSISR